jgi:hypothetical protein
MRWLESRWTSIDRTNPRRFCAKPSLNCLLLSGTRVKSWTHALPANSPAYKKGDPGLSGSYEQRGKWRRPYFNPDPGAFQTSDVTQLKIIAPPSVTAGKSFVFTVLALDADGNHATLADIPIEFQSTDPDASLPTTYTFTPGDLGSHEFVGLFQTPGTQELIAIDPDGYSFASVEVQVRGGRAASIIAQRRERKVVRSFVT